MKPENRIMSKNTVVIGAQWGDEGKGKIVDLLTESADIIVRFQGGNNAGHTLVVGKQKLILHLIPSGILHEGKKCLIGNGVVLDPQVFCAEVDKLREFSIAAGPERLKISRKTQVIMPYHKQLDSLREEQKSGPEKIGTTGRGIGPAYEDKAARIGIRAVDLSDPDLMLRKIEQGLLEKNVLFEKYYQVKPLAPKEVWERIEPYAQKLTPYLTDVSSELEQGAAKGELILFEGAQGTHLDIDHGTYPFVTSSNTVAGNASAGSGCGPILAREVMAVVKAYTTRVGSGPFPTELLDETGVYLQEKGSEFGATTGRKRRCGWLDLALLKESVRLNAPNEIALTKLDVLSGLPEIKVCMAYRHEGRELAHPPQKENGLSAVEPIYQSLPGWAEDVAGVRSWEGLPRAARDYILLIEDVLKTRVAIVSVGPDRSQTLFR